MDNLIFSHASTPTNNSNTDALGELLTNQYKERVIELATQSKYKISLHVLTNSERMPDPFNPTTKFITVYRDWEEKTYKRHKITVEDYQKAKELLEQLEEQEEDEEEDNDNLEQEQEGEEYKLKNIDSNFTFYQFLAQCYLKMPPEEFQRADWGMTRAVLDACQYRTVHSLPDFSKGLYEFFHFGKAHLTEDEHEHVRMYRLWTGKAKTKPWEINVGGAVYEEDLNAILKMEELDISGQNYRAKKESAGKVGADGEVHRKSTRVKER